MWSWIVKLLYIEHHHAKQAVSLWKCEILHVWERSACRCFSSSVLSHYVSSTYVPAFLILTPGSLVSAANKDSRGIFSPLSCGSVHSPHKCTLNLAPGPVIHLVKMSHVTCFYAWSKQVLLSDEGIRRMRKVNMISFVITYPSQIACLLSGLL